MTKDQVQQNSINMKRITLIQKIAARGARLHKKLTGERISGVHLALDISQCNQHCQLDLEGLLKADSGSFGHDVFGIKRHLNRKTGELENLFVPRFAMPEDSIK